MNEFGNEHVLRSLDVRRNKNGVHVEFVAVCEFVAVLITKLYKKNNNTFITSVHILFLN